MLSQLSYGPPPLLNGQRLVGLGGVEPLTSPLSGVRSNQLSYRPSSTTFQPDRLACYLDQVMCVGTLPKAYFETSRKEVIQPQVPLRLPCYDLTPVIKLSLVNYLFAVSSFT